MYSFSNLNYINNEYLALATPIAIILTILVFIHNIRRRTPYLGFHSKKKGHIVFCLSMSVFIFLISWIMTGISIDQYPNANNSNDDMIIKMAQKKYVKEDRINIRYYTRKIRQNTHQLSDINHQRLNHHTEKETKKLNNLNIDDYHKLNRWTSNLLSDDNDSNDSNNNRFWVNGHSDLYNANSHMKHVYKPNVIVRFLYKFKM